MLEWTLSIFTFAVGNVKSPSFIYALSSATMFRSSSMAIDNGVFISADSFFACFVTGNEAISIYISQTFFRNVAVDILFLISVFVQRHRRRLNSLFSPSLVTMIFRMTFLVSVVVD